MALDPGPNDLAIESLTGPAREERQKFDWWGFGLPPLLFLCFLGMTQAWLYGWARVQQKEVDRMRIAVERVRSQVRQKSYRYAEAVNQFHVRPEEESVYRQLTLDRVERISVDMDLPKPTVESTSSPRGVEQLTKAVRFVQTQWAFFIRFLHTEEATEAKPAAAATLTVKQGTRENGASGTGG